VRTKFDIYVDTSAGRLHVPVDVNRSVASVSALPWFIRYIYYRTLQFLNYVIMIKTKVFLPQVQVTLADGIAPKDF